MNMIEKVAKAIYYKDPQLNTMKIISWGKLKGPVKKLCLMQAKAAIEALREPTKGMIEKSMPYMDSYSSNIEWWYSMIDNATREE